MQTPIFDSNSDKVKLGKSILSFTDCPNKCNNGYYVDPYLHKRKKCLYCEEKRKQLANKTVQLDDGNSVKKLLNLPDSFIGYGTFDISTIIPEKQAKLMKSDTVDNVSNVLNDMLNSISVGVASEASILFNLGLNSYPCNFIYAYLMRAYISGMTVSPYLTARDVYLMLKYETESIDDEVLDLGENISIKYKDLLSTDVCVIHITTGANYSHVRAVKGLMQMRAHNNKSTIIFTDAWWFNNSSTSERYLKASLESLYSEDIQSKAVAKLVKISYNYTKESNGKMEDALPQSVRQSNNLVGMSQKQLNNLMSSQTNL